MDITITENLNPIEITIVDESVETVLNVVVNESVINNGAVDSVNGQTGVVVLDIPTATSDLTNDSNFIPDAPADGKRYERINNSWSEKNYIGVALENTTATGTVNLDLDTFETYELTLTGNTTITVTNTPAVGETVVKNVAITSTATETLTLPVSWNVYGTYADDGTRNLLTINFANYTTAGLVVDCFINQPS